MDPDVESDFEFGFTMQAWALACMQAWSLDLMDIFGEHIIVYNDHKPLEDIFRKSLLSTPMQIQSNVSPSSMELPDALSRAQLTDKTTIQNRNMPSCRHCCALHYAATHAKANSQVSLRNCEEQAERLGSAFFTGQA